MQHLPVVRLANAASRVPEWMVRHATARNRAIAARRARRPVRDPPADRHAEWGGARQTPKAQNREARGRIRLPEKA
ncbi:MAG: hypothetical protein KIT83_15735 [Bryobacterales bacterium]|nr:hypothetical protein [Bryobacterales bacterium]